MSSRVPAFLLERPAPLPARGGRRHSLSFIDKSVRGMAGVITTAYAQWETASMRGFFQGLDPRVKTVFLLFFIVITSVKSGLQQQAALFAFTLALAIASRVGLVAYLRRVLLLGFLFGFLPAIPAALNLVTTGTMVLPILRLEAAHDFWIYHVPREIGLTGAGLVVAARITMRVVNSIALSFLVLHTTQFPDIIKSLKVFRVPDIFLLIITLSYKYIFIFARTAADLYLAIKCRYTGNARESDVREIVAGRMAFLFRRARQGCEEVYLAMLARGFNGTVAIYSFGRIGRYDLLCGAGLALAGVAILLW